MKVFVFVVLSVASLQITSAKHAIACEHSWLTLSCAVNETIEIIEANYGRTSQTICQNNGQTHNLNCKAGGTTAILSGSCDYTQACSIQASNQKFGDPCQGTFKYLDVQYKCISHLPGAHVSDVLPGAQNKEDYNRDEEITKLKTLVFDLQLKKIELEHLLNNTVCPR